MNHQPEAVSIPWREWSEDAFSACRQEEKPILLALTATWCHWCHVMDGSSYSDPRIIDLVSSRFIPVRVDVDQRPDVSRRYNQGALPSMVVLNGGGDVLLGRAYTPPDEALGLLEQAAGAYPGPPGTAARPAFGGGASGLSSQPEPGSEASPVERVLDRLRQLCDPEFGGFGLEPKQPPWEALRLLIAWHGRSGEKSLPSIVLNSLDGMRNGLYDFKDQGFFRYSVSRDWKTPHYEKMAATNANLAILYLEAYQVTRRTAYRDAALGAINYLLGVLYDPARGLFRSSQDAWEDYYRLPWKDRDAAEKPTVDPAAYAGWNALAALALARAYGALGTPSYRRIAEAVLEVLWRQSWNPGRGIAHVAGGPGDQPGVLEDHVLFVRACLDLYQATGRDEHLRRAAEVAGYVGVAFGAPDGGYYDIADGAGAASQPLFRERPVLENSLLAEALATLSCLTGETEYLRDAGRTLAAFEAIVPGGTYLGPNESRRMEGDEERLFLPAGSAWARARHMVSCGPVHLVVVGPSDHSQTKRLLRAALKVGAPHRVVQAFDPGEHRQRVTELGFPAGVEPRLYACMDGMCLAPITSAAEAARLTRDRPWAAG